MIGKLGITKDLTAGVNELLYTVPALKSASVNIRVANRNYSPIKLSIAIGAGANPALEDYISYELEVEPNGISEDTGIALSANEKVWIKSDTTGVSARIHGVEE